MALFINTNINNLTTGVFQLIGPTSLSNGTTHYGNPELHPSKYVICNTSATSIIFSLYYKSDGASFFLINEMRIGLNETVTWDAEELVYDSDNYGLWAKIECDDALAKNPTLTSTATVTIKMK